MRGMSRATYCNNTREHAEAWREVICAVGASWHVGMYQDEIYQR